METDPLGRVGRETKIYLKDRMKIIMAQDKITGRWDVFPIHPGISKYRRQNRNQGKILIKAGKHV